MGRRVRAVMCGMLVALGTLGCFELVSGVGVMSSLNELLRGGSDFPISQPSPSLTPLRNCSSESSSSQTNREMAALCVIAKDEEAYLQEFVDYHLALGFDLIYIFDNSDQYDLEQWAQENKDCRVKVAHFPGTVKQGPAYAECSSRLIAEGNYGWVAFYDVDEFLILKKHMNVVDFLKQYLPRGSLAINWRYFGMSGKKVYEPLPVTKRFQYRFPEEAVINHHVKAIVRLEDLDMRKMEHWNNPHYFPLLNRTVRLDTNGSRVKGPFNPVGKVDVVALYHFGFKSMKEYIAKRTRGRADAERDEAQIAAMVAEAEDLRKSSDANVFDDTAWRMMKELVPRYNLYD
jgi:Glycosyl transferase family 2